MGNKRWKKVVTVIALVAIMLVCGLTCALKWRSIGKSVYHVFRDYDRQTTTIWGLLDEAVGVFEGNFNNFMWGGKALASLDANLNFLLRGEINSVQVLLGKEKWLFYQTISDGEPMVDYLGEEYFSDSRMNQIAEHLKNMEQVVEGHGAEFIVMVCPNKEQVMGQYMPEHIKKVSDESRTDRLVSYLKKNTNLKLVYPKKELERLSQTYELYYRYDTHWNVLGGYIAVQQLLEIIEEERDYLENMEITSKLLKDHSSGDRDLARIIGMTWMFNDEQEYFLNSNEFDQWDETTFRNEQAPVERKVLVVGDSFRIGMKPTLYQTFSEVKIIHRDEYTAALLDEFDPDVVVLEYVERYCGEMAGFFLE